MASSASPRDPFSHTDTMPLPSSIAKSLSHFASSSSSFQIIHTLPPSLARLPTRTLYILDSSFNPPTFAHMRMCLSALQDDDKISEKERGKPMRLLLLLATQNADKPAQPASFEQRLAMMGILAEDVRCAMKEGTRWAEVGAESSVQDEKGMAEEVEAPSSEEDAKSHTGDAARGELTKKGVSQDVIIDVGVTKAAMFVEKAKVIGGSGVYTSPLGGEREVEQVHLTGYDTLRRLLDPGYYPPDHTLASLQPLFEKHRTRVTMRTPPSRSTQRSHLRRLGEGEYAGIGFNREWTEKIQFVEGRRRGEAVISSTKARACFQDVNKRNSEGNKYCSGGIVEHVFREKLYLNDGIESRATKPEEKDDGGKQDDAKTKSPAEGGT